MPAEPFPGCLHLNRHVRPQDKPSGPRGKPSGPRRNPQAPGETLRPQEKPSGPRGKPSGPRRNPQAPGETATATTTSQHLKVGNSHSKLASIEMLASPCPRTHFPAVFTPAGRSGPMLSRNSRNFAAMKRPMLVPQSSARAIPRE
jgi:hypothetical protein